MLYAKFMVVDVENTGSSIFSKSYLHVISKNTKFYEVGMFKKIKYYFKYKFMTGHITIGKLTMYGRNAMHWGCHLYTKKYGYVCWRLPFTDDGHWYPLYLYFSPNATPWAATFMIGKKESKDDWVRARIRYTCFGHNFDVHGWNEEYQMENYHILRGINNMVDSRVWSYQNYAKEHGYDKD